MSISEFALIQRYFTTHFPKRDDVILGIGDDAALCQAPEGMQLAISVDTLVSGVHFPIDTNAKDIGYKALAVNLSDMAAMGATPAWMTLAITCPMVDTQWLTLFTQGLLELATRYHVGLIGGDTTCGSLAITIQLIGFVPKSQALCRHQAKVGDSIFVTGTLGDAGLGLASIQKRMLLSQQASDYVEKRLNNPTPRVEIGQMLRSIASSAIDISDGLLADLGHITVASGVGATIELEKLPLSQALMTEIPLEQAWQLALTAGDDYELCFTVPAERLELLAKFLANEQYTCIGKIENQTGVRCIDVKGEPFGLEYQGYQHFS